MGDVGRRQRRDGVDGVRAAGLWKGGRCWRRGTRAFHGDRLWCCAVRWVSVLGCQMQPCATGRVMGRGGTEAGSVRTVMTVGYVG